MAEDLIRRDRPILTAAGARAVPAGIRPALAADRLTGLGGVGRARIAALGL